MIIGIGVDVVNIDRFAEKLASTPKLVDRLFRTSERTDRVETLAGRFAVKEAVIKAFGGIGAFAWHDVIVGNNAHGKPDVVFEGALADLSERLGVTSAHVSISHDAPIATAFVILEGPTG